MHRCPLHVAPRCVQCQRGAICTLSTFCIRAPPPCSLFRETDQLQSPSHTQLFIRPWAAGGPVLVRVEKTGNKHEWKLGSEEAKQATQGKLSHFVAGVSF